MEMTAARQSADRFKQKQDNRWRMIALPRLLQPTLGLCHLEARRRVPGVSPLGSTDCH
jgi:hypothetical protein